MEKTVSCIVPFYNYREYLREALESVFGQTRIPDEVILVDDCSTQDISDILKDFPSVRVIRHDRNRGLAAARNTGIEAATSEYVFSFDSDDILRPEAVEQHLKLAAYDTVVTMPLIAFGAESYTAYPEKGSWEIFKERNCIYSNSLFPKSLWYQVGGFDESETMRLGLEDWLWWSECALYRAKFVTGTYPSLLWRRHSKSMSSTSANPNWDKIRTYMKTKLKNKYRVE